MRNRLSMFIALTILFVLNCAPHAGADATRGDDSSRVEQLVELPRTFQCVRLGMARGDVVRVAHKGLVRATQENVVVMPGQDRYVKQVEYLFYNGTLYSMQTHYRPERIPGGAEALVKRLKDTYGPPAIDGNLQYGPAPGVLSEKQYVWSDGRTQIALVERERDIEAGAEIVLAMSDLQLMQIKDEATREQQRHQINDVPIPMPERASSNHTATRIPDRADRHVGLAMVRNQSS